MIQPIARATPIQMLCKDFRDCGHNRADMSRKIAGMKKYQAFPGLRPKKRINVPITENAPNNINANF